MKKGDGTSSDRNEYSPSPQKERARPDRHDPSRAHRAGSIRLEGGGYGSNWSETSYTY